MFKTCKWSIVDNQHEIKSVEDTVDQYFYPPEVIEKYGKTPTDKACYQLKLMHKFDFSSKLQRMSAIMENRFDPENKYTMFVKGSPEMIKHLAVEDTVPKNYDQTLKKYTQKGLRVISLAYKYYKDFDPSTTEQLRREDCEKDVIF